MGFPRPTIRSLALALTGLTVCAGLAWVGDVFLVHDNFRAAAVDLYRSGQLRADQWSDSYDKARYRSVLNLVGEKDASWYRTEVRFAAEHGLEHYDYALSAHIAPTLKQMNEIVDVMRRAPKPILIHCKNGSDRSGLVAALYRLAVEGQPHDVAEQQLSLWYGHFPWLGSRSEAMDDAFAQFSAVTQMQAEAAAQTDKPL